KGLKVTPLALGQTVTTPVMNGASPYNDVYYSLDLEPGEYEVSARFNRANGDEEFLNGLVTLLDAQGSLVNRFFINVFGAMDAGELRGVGKVAVAGKETRLLRVRSTSAQSKAIITLRPWPAE